MKKMLTILALAATCCFAGCKDDTDDLWDEVNGLKSRVEALETQVKVLNDNIEALSALAQQGATITEAKEENGTWTITLSNGDVLTLKQGSEAEAVVPVMGIDAEGYWVVDYRDGKGFVRILVDGKPVKSTAVDGFTPKFRIDANSCWEVSYDGGKTYEPVLGADGRPVSAVGSGEVTDKFFAKAEVQGDMFHIELLTGESFDIPIVPDFYCRIVAPEGVQVFSSRETKRFEVQVNGVENVLISTPDGWSAQLTDMVDGKATLVVTAPETTTRALADNTKDVTLLATAGYYACIAKIQVETAGGVVIPPPSVSNVAVVADRIEETSLTFNVYVSEDADAWMYLLQPSATAAPEASAIAASGKMGTGNEVTVEGLNASTEYVLYVIAIKNPNTYSDVKASDKVTTREHRDYIDYYEEGITIDGVRYDSTNSVLVQESMNITENGIYFLDPAEGAEITLKAGGAHGLGQLVLIGRKSNVKPEVAITGIVSMNAEKATDGFVFKNVKLNASKHTNYVFNFDGVLGTFDRFIMEDCVMEGPTDKPLSYFSKESGLKKIMFARNRIHANMTGNEKQFHVLNFTKLLVGELTAVEFTDNVIYSDQDKVVKGVIFATPNKANASLNVKLINNTLINYVGNPNAYVSVGAIGGVTISKNAIWASPTCTLTSYLCKLQAASTALLDVTDNVIFGLKEKGQWSSHSGTLPEGMDKKPGLTVLETDPFASKDFTTGQFVLNADFSGYGSSLK